MLEGIWRCACALHASSKKTRASRALNIPKSSDDVVMLGFWLMVCMKGA